MYLGPCLTCQAEGVMGPCLHFPKRGLRPYKPFKLATEAGILAALEEGRKAAEAFRDTYCRPRWPRMG